MLIQTSSCKFWGLMTSHPVMANYICFPRCNGRPTSKHEHNDLAEENTICKMDTFTFNAQKIDRGWHCIVPISRLADSLDGFVAWWKTAGIVGFQLIAE